MPNCQKCGLEVQTAKRVCSACGTSLSIDADSPTSTFFRHRSDHESTVTGHPAITPMAKDKLIAGNYRLIAQLGEGGMGVVYQAEDIRLKRTVALKFVRDLHLQSQPTRLRLVQEARAAANLMHTNIAAVFDLGETDDFEFIVMEFVNGRTLKQEIRARKQLTIEQISGIFNQICRGLSAAHDKGIIHRDIKSSNIMLSDDDQVKITDFGLALVPDVERRELTEPGTLVGTTAYMAPELISGQPASCLTDIWAVGVVLYEMLTGKLPFNGPNWPSLINAIHNEQPKPVSLDRTDIPDPITKLVDQLLQKDPSRRLGSLADLRVDPLHSEATKNRKPGGPRLPSVAVLPFSNRSLDPEKEFFGEGLTDELISALTATKNLHVVARSSSFSFKDRNIDVRAIGHELNVETIIEGSVRWSGNRLRINVQAVNVPTGYQIWSQVFDRELDDIFEIQEETALAIVQKLHGQLNSVEEAQLKKRPTDSIEAYEYYLHGMYFLNSMNPSLFAKGMELQERAIAADPTFQLAHVEIAEAYCRMAEWDLRPALEAYPRALEWAKLALGIDESNAETHACLGSIHTHFTWQWQNAEDHFRRALDLNPNLPMAHDRYAEFLRYTGKFEEAIAAASRARDLDPLAPSTNWTLAATLNFCGQAEKALPLARKNVEMFSNLGFMYFLLGIVQENLGLDEEALQTLQQGSNVSGPMPELVCLTGFIHGKTGNPELAGKCLQELNQMSMTRHVNPFTFALVYAGLQLPDPMFEYLEKTYEARNWQLVLVKITPMFDFARNDPRYTELLKKIGLDVF